MRLTRFEEEAERVGPADVEPIMLPLTVGKGEGAKVDPESEIWNVEVCWSSDG